MTADATDAHREQQWARAAQRGDRDAMEALLAALYDHIHAVCRRICANEPDADDTTQDALIAIVRALPNFDGRASVRTWAHRIATNAALDELRRRARRPVPADGDTKMNHITSAGPDLDDRVSARLDLDDSLTRIIPEFRAAVVLRDVIGMEYAEIAATLDIPVGTVRSRIARGRRQLAALLDLDGNRSTTAVVSSEEP